MKKTPQEHFEAGMFVMWSEEAKKDPTMRFLSLSYGVSFRALAVGRCGSGSHSQDVEIDVRHPKGLRTWICGVWLTAV